MGGFQIGPLELIVVLAIALIVLGPKKLPEVGRSIGNGMREFKESLSGESRDDDRTERDSVEAGALGGLAAAAGRQARAVFAIELENAAVRAYIDAHRKLRDARAMQLASSILGNEGQHLTVLRSVAGRPEVPSAFERGAS